MTTGKVHINADDYKVMLPYLADTHFDFVAEPGLARGDVILKFAGVELQDIAETRLGGQYAETAKTMAKAPTNLAPETAPAETAPAETALVAGAAVEGAAASNPVQNANDAASENAQYDQPPSPSDETSS
jgi:hypothetical protein